MSLRTRENILSWLETLYSPVWKHYWSSVWSNTTQSNLDKLQVVNNFACRIVSGAGKSDHITPLLKDLCWLPVKQQLYFLLAVLVFEFMTGYAPAYLKSKFVKRSAVSTRTTRNSKMLRSQSSALLMAKGPSNIERRPFGIKELKLSESVKRFKRQRLLLDASFSLLIIFRVIITTATLTLKSPVETRQ